MKKLAVVLVMGVIIVYYIISMKKVGGQNSDNSNIGNNVNTTSTLEDLVKSMEEEYPISPRELIIMHNDLMDVGYSTQIQKDNIEEYVTATRSLYSKQFRDMNPIEAQVEAFESEVYKNKEESLSIISSEIIEVTLVQSEETGDSREAQVIVKHRTNKGDLEREYAVIKEDGKWKINGWSRKDGKDDKDTIVTEE